jgi:hypothetical protein
MAGCKLSQQRCQENKTGQQKEGAADQTEWIACAYAGRHEEDCRGNKQDPAPQLKTLLGNLRHDCFQRNSDS